jgi:serine/threonine protein kinase
MFNYNIKDYIIIIDMTNKLLEDEYIFQWKIGHGSFGEVWKVTEKTTNNEMAFKIEEKKDIMSSKSKSMLRYEYKIYMNMEKTGLVRVVPKVYKFMSTPRYNIMVMELLDKSLEKIFNENNKSFPLGTILWLGINMVELLESIHKTGYLHRDIKPNNFMFRKLDNNKLEMCIMDFGLAKKYLEQDDKKNKIHIPLKTGRSLIGTARYASTNIHMGIEPSRRDELMSIGYILVYFCNGKLPWQGLKKKSGIDHIENIGEKKMGISIDKLCKNLLPCFKDYLKYCSSLKFEEEPNYKYLKDLLKNSANENKLKLDYIWSNNLLNE